jgi:hypothetical protein
MADEPIPLIALTYHTIGQGALSYAEGDTYAIGNSDDLARNVIVCGFAEFDPNATEIEPLRFRVFGN